MNIKLYFNKVLHLKSSYLLFFLILFLVALGILNNFVQDDAFISFRYARNLAEHNILSWNIDDIVKIEGYTNFLWTCLIAIAIKFNIDAVIASKVLGIICGIGTLLVTYSLGNLIFKNSKYALLTVFLLGTNYTFSAYMTGGLETQLQTFLISLVCLFTFKAIDEDRSSAANLILIGVFAGLAILTRLDSCLIIGLFVIYLLYKNYSKTGYKANFLTREILIMALPVLVLVLPWLIWKFYYYGNILPNSFYLKGTVSIFSLDVLKSGLGYIFSFFGSYQFFPFIIILFLHYKQLIKEKFLLALVIIIAFWIAYILKVGGDFMEYRFFVSILPYIIILITWSITRVKRQWIKFVLVFAVVASSISHQFLFDKYRGIVSVEVLRNEVVGKKYSWSEAGIKLKELFGRDSADVVIATTAAGAIPYYSQFKTIDMLGLNDPWIAQYGEPTKYFRPGHNKWAKLDYYLKEKVNFIIGHPQFKEKGWSETKAALSMDDFDNFHIASFTGLDLPPESSIIEVPLNENYNFYILYIIANPAIDRVITEQNLKVFPIAGLN